MIWVKTDAGRQEMQCRAQVKDRALRNLLLLIDGQKSEHAVLACVPGLGAEAFELLAELGLIAPKQATALAPAAPARAAPLVAPAAPAAAVPPAPPAATAPAEAGPVVVDMDYEQFTARLTQLISSELGLRGFRHTLAVEKAATVGELLQVAEAVLDAVRARRGEAVAWAARRTLFGS